MALSAPRKYGPPPAAIRLARHTAGLTQAEAADTVRASLRGWQQWEAGDRAMPPGLFELFMIKTGQWPLDDTEWRRSATRGRASEPTRNPVHRPA
ncbi:hypothetical protein CDO44_21905 [Pigmentiphaga sp. NML080357]|uniref:helix-turn-helix transcriptional regulator n=1 Tax=Pigmentiphaga sp. NML080357 TaxID=2008675 RepID=UPI000B40DFB9|nr:helix-turn-helix transcriptional regulator [Pigmentiphaga sp. NML080357]OVZ55818.1 hypothetical protein CDO44_21905 [Pigmentiphaga sp. NML080357]